MVGCAGLTGLQNVECISYYAEQSRNCSTVAFLESGEIYTEIPNALGKHPIIRINGLYELPEQGEFFIDRAAQVLKEVGIGLEFVLDKNDAIRNM